MNGTLECVLIQGLDEIWPSVEPLIESVLDHGDDEMTPFDVLRSCRCGDMQLWIARTDRVIACAVTEIKTYPRKKALVIRLLVGDGFEHWYEDGMAMFDLFRREHGCSRIELHGRQGWMRKLKDWDFHTVSMIWRGSHAH